MPSGSKIDQPQKECPSRAQPPSDFGDTSHRLHGRRFSHAQAKQRCARSKLIYCCYGNACTQSSALVIVIELRAQRTAASLCDDDLMVPKENASIEVVQSNVKSTHGTAGGRLSRCEKSTNGAAGGLAWLRPSVYLRAIGTRCRRGWLPLLVPTVQCTFIVVIEVRTVQDTRCCVRNKCLLQLADVSHFCTENRIRPLVFAA